MAQRDRADDRHVVAGKGPDGRDLHEPPDVPGVERQHGEDVVLVVGQVAQVGERSAGRDEWEPEHDDDRRSDGRRADDLASTAVRPEPSRERQDEGQCLRLRRHAHGQGRSRQAVPPVDREHDRRQRRQEVDALVLAPPRADVDDGGVEKDDRGGDHRPPRPGPQRIGEQQGQADVGQRGRDLHRASGSTGRSCRRRSGTPVRPPPARPRCRP